MSTTLVEQFCLKHVTHVLLSLCIIYSVICTAHSSRCTWMHLIFFNKSAFTLVTGCSISLKKPAIVCHHVGIETPWYRSSIVLISWWNLSPCSSITAPKLDGKKDKCEGQGCLSFSCSGGVYTSMVSVISESVSSQLSALPTSISGSGTGTGMSSLCLTFLIADSHWR